MGFYGNATYYLPNGIAQYVVDGVITAGTRYQHGSDIDEEDEVA